VRGKYDEAAFSFISIVPIAGDAIGKGAKGVKIIVKASSKIDDVVDIAKGLDTGTDVIKGGLKSSTKLTNGMKMKTDDALDAAAEYLEKGYKDMGNGRYVSADGTRQVRFTDSDLATTNNHAGAPHMNFEVLVPNPSKPGKMIPNPKQNIHVYLED